MSLTQLAIEHEESLIGAALVDPRNLDGVAEIVNRRDFADLDLGELYELLAAMHSIGKPIRDVRVVQSELMAMGSYKPGRLDAQRLATLINNGVSAAAKYHALQVRDLARRRTVLALRNAIAEAEDLTISLNDTIAGIRNGLDAVDQSEIHEIISMGEAAKEVIQEIRSGKRAATIFSGLESFDQFIGGIRPGEVVVVGARPGEGKTSMAMQYAIHNAEQGKHVLFISLEMVRTELAAREICKIAGIDSRLVRSNSLLEDEREQIESAANDLQTLPIMIYDPPSAAITHIRGVAAIEKRRRGVDLIVLDYIGLVTPRDPKAPRHEQIGEISRQLKKLAKEIGVPVLVLCQLNREAVGEPRLSHLRESGSIEQDADIVILLQREVEAGICKAFVAKHRHGAIGKLDLRFDARATRFEDRVLAELTTLPAAPCTSAKS